ncbi:hypothetical protein Vafri_4565 [Volvox africanus]|uniref:Uncharacterized protein n=1 Tax=Volvox africanus TaxID=51714 RepID=A0A8J4AZJ6_9CHLO|nr:hypothetical protein Vafri_4565 [Volvox africanus]
MILTSLSHITGSSFRAPYSVRQVRTVPRPPCGVLTNNTGSGSSKSFLKLHQEVLQDSEWYGPEAPGHTVSPAAAAAAPGAVATRGDVRLMADFSKFLKKQKLDLSALFCNEAILSGDSRLVCDPRAGHHTELLSEFLTSGGMRVGEELPHWFVNGNLRGAIKCWMATRPAAAALTNAAASGNGAAAAGAALDNGHHLARHRDLVASVSEHVPLGPAASLLVDHMLAAMPEWTHGSVQQLAGWEPAEGVQATAEDVAMLHCFGAIVYASRLDVAVFLQQLCGADPFAWAMAQISQGVISEPEPWLLERFFMSRHSVGEALPLWFAKWGVREEIAKWTQQQQANRLVQELLEARGVNTGAAAGLTVGAEATLTRMNVAAAGGLDGRAVALDLLEASTAGLMASVLARHGASPSAMAAGSISCSRDVRVYDKADPSGTPYAIDLLATCSGSTGTGQGGVLAVLVAVAVQLPYGGGAVGDVAVTLRQAKERLDWLAFLLQREGGLTPQAAIAKVVLLLPQQEQQQGEQAAVATLPESVLEYVKQGDVLLVQASDLPYKGT